jgi:hypothetical protein
VAGSRAREASAIACAALAHVAVLASSAWAPSRPDELIRVHARATEIDVLVEPAPVAKSEPVPTSELPAPSAPAPAPEPPSEPRAAAASRAAPAEAEEPGEPEPIARVEQPAPRAEVSPTAPAPGGEGPPAAPGAPPGGPPAGGPGAPGEYSPPGSEPPALPGLGGAPVWAVPGAVVGEGPRPAPTAPTAPTPVERDVASKVLTGTLRKRDKEIGIEMPAGGVVAGAIADSARTAETAGEARATFEVKLDAGGKVEGIKVKSFSAGNNATWQRVARQAASSLAARGLDTNGEPATVIVKVESQKRYPAGSKEKVDVQPVCVNEVIEEMAAQMAELAGEGRGLAEAPPPRPPTLDPRKRFCIPVGVGGVGDASNIGAHKQTVVKSTFQVMRRGEKTLPGDEVKPVEDRARWLTPRESRAEKPKVPRKKKKKKNGEQK